MYTTRPRCLVRGRLSVSRATLATRHRPSEEIAPALRFPRPPRPPGTPPPSSPSLLPSRAGSRVQGRRHYAAAANNNNSNTARQPRSVAVLGGGLTGLATAWHLTRVLPQARITLYEASDRLGGWIDTQKVNVKTLDGGEGTVHFERGARMVKPQGRSTKRITVWDDLPFFEMVSQLNLVDQLVHAPVAEQSSTGYIYYPDRLVAMPTLPNNPLADPLATLKAFANIVDALFQPVLRDVIPSFVHSLGTTDHPQRLDMVLGRSDVSIGDYYAYKFGRPGLVDKVLSGLMHGVTGGDVWKLSMASGPFADQLVPKPPDQPITNALVRAVDHDMMRQILTDQAVFDLASAHHDSDAVWFRDGFSTLTNALVDSLKRNPNVVITTGDPVTSVRRSDHGLVLISTNKNSQSAEYEKVISTIYAKTLAGLTDGRLPSLAKSTAVTIQLVNLWYPVPFANLPHRGFGYLLPQALSHDMNPECVLGVIFDSDREFPPPSDRGAAAHNRGADTVHGTKLTVMMGGHYWDDLPESFLPDPDTAVALAKRAVERHLSIPPELSQHATAAAKLCRDCIPQHTVGHAARMRAAHGELDWAFGGRLAVAGPSYQRPGVLGALRAARDAAAQAADPERDAASSWPLGDTGLARFTREQTLAVVSKGALPLRYGSRAYVDEDGDVQVDGTS